MVARVAIHEGVIEILVGGIERMVDLEIAIDLYISVEPTGKSGNAAGKNSRPAADVIGIDRGSGIGALSIKSGGPGGTALLGE